MESMILKIEAHILTILQVTTMTTDVVIRYAENINKKNEITDFNLFSISGKDISAVSWELPNVPLKNFGEGLLREMVKNYSSGLSDEVIYTFVVLSAEQPDNAIVNHRKTWGLLNVRGVKVNGVDERKDLIVKGNEGLILSGLGSVNLNSAGVIESLINSGEKVFFSTIQPTNVNMTDSIPRQITEWMSNIWINNGVVFFALGRYDEPDCEIVALGQKRNLQKLQYT